MGRIAAIKRLAVHDGPGLRTTLFLKGCPLQCKWCHNPECISVSPQIAYIAQKCLHCGECISLCRANRWADNTHQFNREMCNGCGECQNACLGGAFTFYGKEISPREALEILLEDRDFYAQSGGGITLSGGEPLMQAAFSAEILRLCHQEGLHTAIDTCGFAARAAVDTVLPYTDLFLYDLKAATESCHIACTGQSNRIILENLRFLSGTGKPIEIRIPYIPGMNDREMPGIAAFLKDLPGISLVRILPYHPFAASKYASLGLSYPMPENIRRPDQAAMKAAVEIFHACGLQAADGGNLP